MVRSGNKPWCDDQCVLAYRAKQRAHRAWSSSKTQADWKACRVARRHAQQVYVEAEQAFDGRSRALLANASSPWKWWSTVKTAVFDASPRLAPKWDRRGRLVLSAEEKASLFSAHFDAKQCRDCF